MPSQKQIHNGVEVWVADSPEMQKHGHERYQTSIKAKGATRWLYHSGYIYRSEADAWRNGIQESEKYKGNQMKSFSEKVEEAMKRLAEKKLGKILDQSPIAPAVLATAAIDRYMRDELAADREGQTKLWNMRDQFFRAFDAHCEKILASDPKLKKELKTDAAYVRDALQAEAYEFIYQWMKGKKLSSVHFGKRLEAKRMGAPENDGFKNWESGGGSKFSRTLQIKKLPNGFYTYRIYDNWENEVVFDGSNQEKFQFPSEDAAKIAARRNWESQWREAGKKLMSGNTAHFGNRLEANDEANLAKSKFQDLIKITDQIEAKGLGWMRKAGDDMIIQVNNADWGAARQIESAVQAFRPNSPEIDRQTGNLFIKIPKAYTRFTANLAFSDESTESMTPKAKTPEEMNEKPEDVLNPKVMEEMGANKDISESNADAHKMEMSPEQAKGLWDSITAGKMHKIQACMSAMQGKVDDTGAYCNWLAQKNGYKAER